MVRQSARLRRFLKLLQRENLHRILGILLMLMLLSAAALAYFEPNIRFFDALWWSVVTMTTVGYGDISPATTGGRAIAGLIMIIGIGIIGMFTATIASLFVEKKLKEDRGMRSFDFKNHIILCEWNRRAEEILSEWRNDARYAEKPVVLIAAIENKPVDDDNLYFIRGAVNEEKLLRANLPAADTVVILGNDALEPTARDAQVVLATLTVESLNRQAYTIVELVDERNVRHCQRANADEIIVGAEFSSKLISRAALDHGISKVISELLSSNIGNDLYMLPVPEALAGQSFLEVFVQMKKQSNCTILAVQRGEKREVFSNPPVDFTVEAGDHLIVISPTKPE